MTRDQEFIVKTVIGLVMLSVLGTCTYLVAVTVLWLSPGSNALAASSAGAFFLVGFIYIGSWIGRQVGQWLDK